MSELPMTEEQKTRLALASLFGALVEALDKTNPGTGDAFRFAVERRYNQLREQPDVPLAFLETLKWARDASTPFESNH